MPRLDSGSGTRSWTMTSACGSGLRGWTGSASDSGFDFSIGGGTGRFDGASGGATGTGACNQQTGTCVLEIEGVIVY